MAGISDLAEKRAVSIASGATAATLIPAIASQCEHITLLQRTPTYFIVGRNNVDRVEELLTSAMVAARGLHSRCGHVRGGTATGLNMTMSSVAFSADGATVDWSTPIAE